MAKMSPKQIRDFMDEHLKNPGKEIQSRAVIGGEWHMVVNPSYDFHDFEYRFAPERYRLERWVIVRTGNESGPGIVPIIYCEKKEQAEKWVKDFRFNSPYKFIIVKMTSDEFEV